MPVKQGAKGSTVIGSSRAALEAGQEVGDDKAALRAREVAAENATLSRSDRRLQQLEVDPIVNVTIKVPASLRKHWGLEAKQIDSNVTEQIIECMTKRFGLPEKSR